MTDPGERTNIWLPRALKVAVRKAAARETAKSGERVTVSEYIRRAITKALSRGDA